MDKGALVLEVSTDTRVDMEVVPIFGGVRRRQLGNAHLGHCMLI